ncbi:hypothetical protein [Geminicoccus flavidas]|uniref:hypothetical protein n=1 Tax=Geminicoccus flavidas TaxID=2506407 RepID=UPI00135B2ED0|nr:hypothetical protein [Geminicoccus flavidas]
MTEPHWRHQLRIDLPDGLAERARLDPEDALLAPLPEILRRHEARLRCQFDAFVGYVEEARAHGGQGYPLLAWTEATLNDPAKREKFLRSFSIQVRGEETYPAAVAEALLAELRPLEGTGPILRIAHYDTNPANNPQPPAASSAK